VAYLVLKLMLKICATNATKYNGEKIIPIMTTNGISKIGIFG
jgi:hypothetical protein